MRDSTVVAALILTGSTFDGRMFQFIRNRFDGVDKYPFSLFGQFDIEAEIVSRYSYYLAFITRHVDCCDGSGTAA